MLSQARGIKTGIYYHTHYLKPIKVLYRTLGLKTLPIYPWPDMYKIHARILNRLSKSAG